LQGEEIIVEEQEDSIPSIRSNNIRLERLEFNERTREKTSHMKEQTVKEKELLMQEISEDGGQP